MHSKFCTQPHSNFALKLRTHWVSVSSYALKVLHSNYELIECSRTQTTNSLIINEFVRTQSFALNYGCTQTANSLIISEFVYTQSFALNCGCTQTLHSLSATALKLRTHWLSVSSPALKVLHSTVLKKWISLNLSFQSLLYIPMNEVHRQFWWKVFNKAILENKFSSKICQFSNKKETREFKYLRFYGCNNLSPKLTKNHF